MDDDDVAQVGNEGMLFEGDAASFQWMLQHTSIFPRPELPEDRLRSALLLSHRGEDFLG